MKGKGGRKRGQEKNREGEFLYFFSLDRFENWLFSCATAKAERSLSSLYGVFLCVELGYPPPNPPWPGLNGSVPKRYTTFV